ncbi:MAG: LuxR C-terminal-related transcriptional regulator [Candidatus Nanopelagicaceae bacterium]|nr:LuxR C-terminal-related transcriptional regulator [Candidatus Nanopelagicaceae bacterium]
MENLEKITALTEFLRPGVPSLDSIMSYLVMNTLDRYDARAIFLNSVRANGMVWAPAAYGFDKEGFEALPDQSFSIDTPVHRALRTNKIVECGNSDTYLFVGLYGKSAFTEGFAYSLAWPTPGIGVLVAFFNREIELTPFNEIFFLTIGEILSIKLNSPQYHHALGVQQPSRDPVITFALTSRQWEIVQHIRRGLTNAEIATALNFSESLIRQETVQIYRKLGTTGRKELIQRDLVIPVS